MDGVKILTHWVMNSLFEHNFHGFVRPFRDKKMNSFLSIFFIFQMLLFPTTIFGWTSMAHIIAAEIVKSEISDLTKLRMNQIYSNPDGIIPNETNWNTSFYWFRKVVNNSMPYLSGWQTQPRPYDPEGILAQEEIDQQIAAYSKHSIIFSLKTANNVLRHWKSTHWEKNLMLRIFISGILDLHQPCRCANYYSSEFINGDESGKTYIIVYEGCSYTLVELWDSLFLQALIDSEKYLTDEKLHIANDIAENIKKDYPVESFDDLFSCNFDKWAEESYQLAIREVYRGIEDGAVVTSEYMERCRPIAERQLAIAAYRLAHILDRLLNE